jgi:release factor glutamine methyltransferase
LPDSEVWAVENSVSATPYLIDNIRMNSSLVRPIRGDVSDGRLLDGFIAEDGPMIDCIVSNPPYLDRYEMESLQTEVTFEPSSALDGGLDGLKFYRVISCLWKRILKPGGLIAFETGDKQAASVSDILSSSGYENIRVVKDGAKINRVVIGMNLKGGEPPLFCDGSVQDYEKRWNQYQ